MRTYTNPGETISVAVGECFSIALDAIPTTGYEWNINLDTADLVCRSKIYHPVSSAVGAGGEEVFELEATAPYSGEILFEKKREWEKKSVDSRQFHVESR